MLSQQMTMAGPTSRFYVAATVLSAGLIFAIDTFTPFDIAIAVLYAVVVMGSASFLSRQGVMTVSLLCIGLGCASYLIVHGATHHAGATIRLLIAICAITITTFLAMKNQRATLALREQAALLDLTHDAIFVRDASGIITYWNAGAETLYGWTRAEAIGRNAEELLKARLSADPEAALPRNEDRWQGELIQTKRDGTQVVVASRWSIQRDGRGMPVATMETNNDITDQKRAADALHQAHAELSHVARVSTLGELTASIAHEVNQPLAAVVANGEASLRWMQRAIPDLEEARNAVRRMISNGQRASDVVARLRALARKSETVRTRLTLNDIVDDVLPLVERELVRNGIVLELELEPGPPVLLGDRVQLQQVVINLIMNAVQAMAELKTRKRRLTITTRSGPENGDRPSAFLDVLDTGTGIQPDAASKLFTAFFTTKANGMGMGLSICRSIIEAHGGRISVTPGAQSGARFTLNLPASA